MTTLHLGRQCGWLGILAAVLDCMTAASAAVGIGCGTVQKVGGGVTAAVDLGWPPKPAVAALAHFDDGWGDGPVLYVGGHFIKAGGKPIVGLARFNGSDWFDVAQLPVPSWVSALLVVSGGDRSAAAPDVLVAAGSFAQIGGIGATNIALFDGTSWSPLGAGLPAVAQALVALPSPGMTTICALGAFGDTPSRVLAFDGVQWSSMGALQGAPAVMAVHDAGAGPELYVGGASMKEGDRALGALARWTGSEWVAIPGPNGADHIVDMVQGLASWSHDGTSMLFVGGPVMNVNGRIGGINSWDGASWRPTIGSLYSGGLLAVVDDGLGEGPVLYAKVSSQVVGGVETNQLARYNGVFWTATGDGTYATPLGFFDIAAIAGRTHDGSAPGVVFGGLDTTSPQDHLRMHIGCGDPRPGPFGRCAYDVEKFPFEAAVRARRWTPRGDGLGLYDQDVGNGGNRWMLRAGALTEASSWYEPFDMNSAGVVVGGVHEPQTSISSIAFRWDLDTGEYETFGVGGPCPDCWATRILEDGTIFGVDRFNGAYWAYRRTGDITEVLIPSDPAATSSDVQGANEAGIAVGYYWKDGQRPWSLVDGVATPLAMLPGHVTGIANDINNDGLIVGWSRPPGSSIAAILWKDGVPSVLPPLPGETKALARRIDDTGLVIGRSEGPDYSSAHPVVWLGGVPTNVRRLLGWREITSISTLNELTAAGQIIATMLVPWFEYDILLAPRAVATGDVDGDCVVDEIDLALVLYEFGRSDGPADLNGDGMVDGLDLSMVLANW